MGKNYIAGLWICILMLCSSTSSFYSKGDSRRPEHECYRSVYGGGGSNREVFRYEDIGSTGTSDLAGYDRVSLIPGRMYDVRNDATSAESGNRRMPTSRRNVLSIRKNGPKISKYISYNEATHSVLAEAMGIKNDPNEHQLAVMTNLGVNFFDKLREYYAKPLYINSFFRNAELNKLVGGALFSDHMANGDSAGIDIDMDGKYGPTNNELFHHIKKNMYCYKLIAEFPKNGKLGWVHVSYSTNASKNNQKNVYIAVMQKTRKVYLPYEGNESLVK